MKLASGAARVQELLDMGAVVGLGTDGPASNNNLDLFEEMRSASLLGKLISGNPEAMSARRLSIWQLSGERKHWVWKIDRLLEPGKNTDVAIIALNRAHLTPLYDRVSHLVYSAKASDVRV